jgi:hypothetical protein
MPFTIKTTFNFAGYEQGWSEDFYWSQPTTNLDAAESIIRPIAAKRAKLLAIGYILTVVRNAVVVSDTNAKVKRRTDLFEPRLDGSSTWKAAPPNLALLLRWQSADSTMSKLSYLRGVPAGLGDIGKRPNFGFSNYLTFFDSWRAAMTALPAGWLFTTATGPNTAVVESYVLSATTGIVTFTLKAPGLTFPNGVGFKQRVYVSLPGKSPLDGPIVVIPASATTCTSADPIGVHPFEAGQLGIMQIRTQALVTLGPVSAQGPSGRIDADRMVTHKTGRPSYASRGRAPARPKW